VTSVSFGPEVVGMLIAQRPPMLWLDRITAVDLDAPEPTLEGCRYISANEPVFAGHFPRLGLMPGVLTLEGLAQAAEALATLLALRPTHPDLMEDLANVELGATFDRRYLPERAAALRVGLAGLDGRPPSVAGGARVKFVRPIFPGCRLDYRVSLRKRIDHTALFELEASVDREPVVRGSFTTAALDRPWPM
jgi:3-hydroxymyristoyl/3-hydroxydecanoyl-(acyl carrier protein) dehydratase